MVLNVAPDHLDWYGGSLRAYAADKARALVGEVAVAVVDDGPAAALLAASPAAMRVGVTVGAPAEGQLGVLDGILLDRAFGAGALLPAAEVRPSGAHNLTNALAAAALALAAGVDGPAVAAGLRSYEPGGHRNTPVATVGGVTYVDDSKATNPHAAEASLLAYPRVVWIAGGQLKGTSVDDLVIRIADRLAGVVLLGVDADCDRCRVRPTRTGCPQDRRARTERWGDGSGGAGCQHPGAARGCRAARTGRRQPGHVHLLRRSGRRVLCRGGRPRAWSRGGRVTPQGSAVAESQAIGAPTRPKRGLPGRGVRRAAKDWLDRPMTSLHLVLAVFGLLLGFGLLMVLSSSSVRAFQQGESSFAVFTNQAGFALLGLVAFFFVMRMPLRLIRSLSTTAIIVALVLLVAVLMPGVGTVYNGARSWIGVGSTLAVPAQRGGQAGVVALGRSRARRAPVEPALAAGAADPGRPGVPADGRAGDAAARPGHHGDAVDRVPGRAVSRRAPRCGSSGWWPRRALPAWSISPRRPATGTTRIAAWLHPNSVPSSMTYQLYQGLYGMGSGGVFGVGLGNSKMKWNWLPNADSDFIFAIIGEELGLLGALTIVVLFGLLAYTGLRISRRNVDPFVKIVAMAATIWLVGQAIINIGYVVGLLPVTGIPLPMISSGGTSLVVTMVVFGLLANFARREPQAAAALRGLGPRGIAAFLGVGVTMTGSTPRRVTKRRARREAKRAAAATARLDELTASSDDYLRRPGDPGRRPPGGSARPSSIASATASAGRTTGPAGDRNADRTAGRAPMSGSGPTRPAAKPPRQRRYRLRRVFGFPVPGEAGSRSSTGSTGSSRSSRLPRAPGSPTARVGRRPPDGREGGRRPLDDRNGGRPR